MGISAFVYCLLDPSHITDHLTYGVVGTGRTLKLENEEFTQLVHRKDVNQTDWSVKLDPVTPSLVNIQAEALFVDRHPMEVLRDKIA